MVTYKCKGCGGQMEFGGAGGFTCPYCGSRAFWSDADFRANEEFRKKLLSYYKAEADNKDADYSGDRFWTCEGRDSFTLAGERALNIDYMKKYEKNGYVLYIAKESVVYVFDSAADAAAHKAGLARLVFPEADVKLGRSFPALKLEAATKTGGTVLAYTRLPFFYPAEMFAPLPSKHLAWVISRMENFCCELAFSETQFGDISPDSVFINTKTHEGALFGDWRGAAKLKDNRDLLDLRRTAAALAEDADEPALMGEFLKGAPEKDAFADFDKWDGVIEKGFGGHKFEKMD